MKRDFDAIEKETRVLNVAHVYQYPRKRCLEEQFERSEWTHFVRSSVMFYYNI